MNHQFQGNIPELNYVKEPDSASLKAYILKIKGGTALEKASIDSPLTRCDLAILYRLDVCPAITLTADISAKKANSPLSQ
ncbi:hypothetical protein [Glaciecola sp. 33A]|jgi:hypothetical protein|uniref:hypothetical protein n=1 Tax=Glaciecola sp. 33A TaxID=2057807 RepID=UPI000C346F82|nr:hypothetical protein [Glaciecola sp. 33A]PKI01668.1 hypothetical protein CXF81_09545 [Glaciecola sp. 33A]